MALEEARVYTVAQAAERLGCSVRSLYRWEQAGIIPKPERVKNGAVRTRVYSDSTIDQIRTLVSGKLTFAAALRRESDSLERQRIASGLAAELGLHAAAHPAAHAPGCSLALFIVRQIEQFDDARWSNLADRLTSEPGIAASQTAVLWLGKLIAEMRLCLKAGCSVAAALMMRSLIEVATQWANDAAFVEKHIREFCFADTRVSAAIDPVNTPEPVKMKKRAVR